MSDLPIDQIICGIPELHAHGGRGVRHVLSIIDPDIDEPDAFAAYPPHERLTLRFNDIIAPRGDMVLPQPEHVAEVLRFGRQIGRDGLPTLLIHCHAGISRSTASAIALLAQAYPELDEALLFAHLGRARPQAWPNSRMIGFADEQLGRGGRLSAQLPGFYARRLAAQPSWAEEMRAGGRGAEVEMAEAA